MKGVMTRERVASALAAEVGAALGRQLDERVHVNTADHWGESSCVATIPVSGRARGGMTVWIERTGLEALVTKLGHAQITEQALVDAAAALVHEALAALHAQPHFATLAFGAVSIGTTLGGERVPLVAIMATLASGPRCAIAVGADLEWQTDPEDARLETVLDFDLPLVVRFGRAVMPLKALATLGPGAMVDLGRSPDQPVEIVMGDKVLALGEVVVVGGNYGVRVTELTTSKASMRLAGAAAAGMAMGGRA
jgi:flagellar motor switch protein FliN/FliY